MSEAITIGEFRRGFGQVYRRLWRANDLPPYDRMVLANMLERLGQNGSVWPAQATIAEDLGISPRSVWASLKRLQARGWVTIQRRGRGETAVYGLEITPIVKWANSRPKTRTTCDRDSQEMRPRLAPRANTESHHVRGEDPPLEDPSKKIHQGRDTRAKRAPLTLDERNKLIEDFTDLEDVNDQIDAALNHTAVDKQKSEYLYVRNWLRRQRQWNAERANGNAATGRRKPYVAASGGELPGDRERMAAGRLHVVG